MIVIRVGFRARMRVIRRLRPHRRRHHRSHARACAGLRTYDHTCRRSPAIESRSLTAPLLFCVHSFFYLFRCAVASLYEGVSVRPSVRPYVRPLTLRKNRWDASNCPPWLVYWTLNINLFLLLTSHRSLALSLRRAISSETKHPSKSASLRRTVCRRFVELSFERPDDETVREPTTTGHHSTA